MYWHSGMGPWGIGFMVLNAVFLWTLLVGAVFLFYRAMTQHPHHTRNDRAASEQILAERYARGEIDDEEYGRRLNTMRGA